MCINLTDLLSRPRWPSERPLCSYSTKLPLKCVDTLSTTSSPGDAFLRLKYFIKRSGYSSNYLFGENARFLLVDVHLSQVTTLLRATAQLRDVSKNNRFCIHLVYSHCVCCRFRGVSRKNLVQKGSSEISGNLLRNQQPFIA